MVYTTHKNDDDWGMVYDCQKSLYDGECKTYWVSLKNHGECEHGDIF